MIHLNCPGGHIPVETPEDVHRFRNETNDMHDACLLSVEYHTHVRANHNSVTRSCEGESLVLRYQVTSLLDLPIVELTFLNISEWKVPDEYLFGIRVSFAPPTSHFSPTVKLRNMHLSALSQEKCIGVS